MDNQLICGSLIETCPLVAEIANTGLIANGTNVNCVSDSTHTVVELLLLLREGRSKPYFSVKIGRNQN